MTDPEQSPPAAPPPAAPTEDAPATPSTPPVSPASPLRWWRPLLFVVALAFGCWGAWKTFAPAPAVPSAGQHARVEALEQQVATLRRSDQISRDANRDLQGTLAERDEEIAGLRADVAFYERFVGATGQRRGLTVHQLNLRPQSGQAWHFTTTLTQNLNRGAVSSGEVTLSVEGTRDGKLQTLAWDDLRQQPDAPGIAYSFKYFEEVGGDLVLPAGYQPLRVVVRLAPKSGAAVEQSFTWADATGRSAPEA
ncbi:DUF6776 family protein [Luteimonas lutimaris]|uniref:Membrane protein n=1 Tax=Luteimonas lutimaris TaxID=698645 RepID=A0ABP7MKG1_9GAMM